MKKTKILIPVIALLAVLLCVAVALTAGKEEPVEHAGTAQHAPAEQESLTYQDVEYPLKDHIRTILFIGTDSEEPYRKEEKLQDYYNFNQADVLVLLVLDRDTNRAEIIQLNRDTMTKVPWLDVLGNYGGTEFKQLCLAYNYGDGGPKSCLNTVDAVSRLLFGAPIDSYIQLPMSAISRINDLVGGVTVTMEEDLTLIDPAFTQGASVRLNGSQAEEYLRIRMALEDDTNQARMSRHRTYLESFRRQVREALDSDPDFSLKLVEALGDMMQSDMTAQQLSGLVETLDTAEISPIRYPEGELIRGSKFYEFYVNEASLWELVKNAWCQ